MIKLRSFFIFLACGFCKEDKIASVYDYAVITNAISKGEKVVFFSMKATEGIHYSSKIKAILLTIPEIDPSTIKISEENAAMAFGFHPEKVSAAALTEKIQKSLGQSEFQIELLNTLE